MAEFEAEAPASGEGGLEASDAEKIPPQAKEGDARRAVEERDANNSGDEGQSYPVNVVYCGGEMCSCQRL